MPAGRHRRPKKEAKLWIVKYETDEGDVRTDGAVFDDKRQAGDHARDVSELPHIKRAWREEQQ